MSTTVLSSMMFRLNHVQGAWPKDVLEAHQNYTGKALAPSEVPRLTRITVLVEWAEFREIRTGLMEIGSDEYVRSQGIRAYVIGYEDQDALGNGILLAQIKRKSNTDWPGAIEALAKQFKADLITGQQEVIVALNLLGIGPTVDTIHHAMMREHRQRMVEQEHTKRHVSDEAGHTRRDDDG